MDFGNFSCRICGGKLIPKLNELECANCKFIQHPIQDVQITISPENLKKKLDNKEDILLLDVRDKWEFGMVNLKNSKLIPLRELKDNIKSLDKNKMIVTICHHGERSQYAARYLLQNGFKNVKTLDGGIEAWTTKIDNSLKRY